MKITGHNFYQYSTFSALMAGDLVGSIKTTTLLQYGNFGLGTFHACDGELIIFEGQGYQMLASGQVNPISEVMTNPYAIVTNFVSDAKLNFANLSYPAFKRAIEAKLPSKNIFYALKVTGTFTTIKLRTVTKQQEPFSSFKDAAQQQENFILENTSGYLVIFWAPKFANTISVQGFHAHFINDEKNSGGHVFDFEAKSIEVEISYLTNLQLTLPTTESYLDYELDDKTLQDDIKEIE